MERGEREINGGRIKGGGIKKGGGMTERDEEREG